MEILNNFHSIYLIFPLCLTFLLLFKESKLKTFFIVASFILIFVFAETGSDYEAYKKIYESCLEKDVHGEFLFVALCRCFNLLGVSYNIFRIIFLSSFTILFDYSLDKLSKNFTLSFLLAYLIYVIYFVSAIRQFATMAILFFSLHLYLNKNKIFFPIFLNLLAVFIHQLAIFQFVVILLLILYEKVTKKKKCVEKPVLKKYFLLILLVCLALRCGLFVLLRTSIGTKFMNMFYYSETSILNFGLIARIILLICLTNLYVFSKDSHNSNLLFSIYFIGMLLYLIFPFELIMGRLINNIKILEILLIPSLVSSCNSIEMGLKKKSLGFKISLIVLIITIILIFFNQLIVQIGYDKYMHMLWR